MTRAPDPAPLTGSDPAAPLIDGRGLTVRYGKRIAIQDVSLSVSRGEIVTVIGLNGAGKSTLVRALLKLQPVSTGTITHAPGLVIGYAPQTLARDPALPLTVERFVGMGLGVGRGRGARLARAEREAAVAEALDQTGLLHTLGTQLSNLSGGEMRRAALARAIARKPDLLVLDEPAASVDLAGQAALYALIESLRDALGFGVLLVSHDLHIVMRRADRVLCLSGQVHCQGTPQAILGMGAFREIFGDSLTRELGLYVHAAANASAETEAQPHD